MGRRRGRATDLPLNAEINVTSLVDVAFTLLVIFIITAPILQGGIEVAVPRANVQPLTAEDDPIFVTVDAAGRIFIEESEFTAAQFEEVFPEMAAARGFERVYIRADSLSDWGPVMKVFATTARSGVRFSVVAEPSRPN